MPSGAAVADGAGAAGRRCGWLPRSKEGLADVNLQVVIRLVYGSSTHFAADP
jgi:hypothetical protein